MCLLPNACMLMEQLSWLLLKSATVKDKLTSDVRTSSFLTLLDLVTCFTAKLSLNTGIENLALCILNTFGTNV